MTKKEKRWQRMLVLWEEIQSNPSHADLSLWDKVVLLADRSQMTPQGVRKFLLRNDLYYNIVTI